MTINPKLLLIGINARYSHSNPALYYLRTYAKGLEFDIKINEYSINDDLNNIINSIIEEKPDATAFSAYIWNVEIIKSIIQMIKKHSPDCKIILGGPEVSYNPGTWISQFSIDYIVTGNGEAGFHNLLSNRLESQDKIIKIKNPHFSKIPFAYTDSDFKHMKNKYIYYESTRGCPFKCSYCLSSRTDQKIEYRDVEQVKDELKFIISKKPKIIKFVDRTFNSKKSHYRKIWEYLIQNFSDSKTTFHFEIYPELLNNTDLKILSECPKDLFQFEIGIQSTYKKALKAVNRNDSWEKARPIIKKLVDMKNIHIHVDLIAGLPYETFNEFGNSFNNIYNLKADHFQLGFLKILHGTKLSEQSETYGLVNSKKAPYIIQKNKWLSTGDIKRLTIISKLLDLLINQNRFHTTMKALEKIYKSPFVMFNTLADFVNNAPGAIDNKNWNDLSMMILSFIQLNFPDKKKYITDCLRWDWCGSGKSHHYPGSLKSEFTKNVKKTGFKYFISLSKKKNIKYNNITFSQADLKKSIFFKPESSLFTNQYMNNKNMAFFLPDKKVILFFIPPP